MTDLQTAHGTAQTASASRYLQQLCKHWSHKGETEFDATQGTVRFENGKEVHMTATPESLQVTARVQPGDDLAGWTEVIDNHLVRFAFREEFSVDWTLPGQS